MKRLKLKRRSVRKDKLIRQHDSDWYEKIFLGNQDPLGLQGLMIPDDADILRQYAALISDPQRLAQATLRLQQQQAEAETLLGIIKQAGTTESEETSED